MQINVNISDREINNAITSRVEWEIMDEYSEEARNALCVTKASAAKLLCEDAKFMASLTKQLSRGLQFFIDDILYDSVNDADSPELRKLHTKLSKAEKAIDKQAAAKRQEREEREEAERLKKTIEMLTQMGYKITKE